MVYAVTQQSTTPVATIVGHQGTSSDFNSQSLFFSLPLENGDSSQTVTAMLDTGAFELTLPASVGQQLHLPNLGNIAMYGLDRKSIDAYWSQVSFELGNTWFYNVPCVVCGDSPALFGIKWFRDNHYDMQWDVQKNTVTIYQTSEQTVAAT